MKSLYILIMIVAATSISSCSSISKKAKLVKIVSAENYRTVKSKCKNRGPVYDTSEKGAQRAYKYLKRRAARKDANVIVSRLNPTRTDFSGVLGASTKVKGRAYTCPKNVYNNLDAADLAL